MDLLHDEGQRHWPTCVKAIVTGTASNRLNLSSQSSAGAMEAFL